MSVSIDRKRSLRIAAALSLGLVTMGFAPGCDQASAPGSVDLGGKASRDTIQVTPTAPSDGASKPAGRPKDKGQQVRSIKDRPQM